VVASCPLGSEVVPVGFTMMNAPSLILLGGS
jgi:hypothetical protein